MKNIVTTFLKTGLIITFLVIGFTSSNGQNTKINTKKELKKAKKQLETNNLFEAESSFMKILEVEPDNIDCLENLVNIHRENRNYQKFIEYAEKYRLALTKAIDNLNLQKESKKNQKEKEGYQNLLRDLQIDKQIVEEQKDQWIENSDKQIADTAESIDKNKKPEEKSKDKPFTIASTPPLPSADEDDSLENPDEKFKIEETEPIAQTDIKMAEQNNESAIVKDFNNLTEVNDLNNFMKFQSNNHENIRREYGAEFENEINKYYNNVKEDWEFPNPVEFELLMIDIEKSSNSIIRNADSFNNLKAEFESNLADKIYDYNRLVHELEILEVYANFTELYNSQKEKLNELVSNGKTNDNHKKIYLIKSPWNSNKEDETSVLIDNILKVYASESDNKLANNDIYYRVKSDADGKYYLYLILNLNLDETKISSEQNNVPEQLKDLFVYRIENQELIDLNDSLNFTTNLSDFNLSDSEKALIQFYQNENNKNVITENNYTDPQNIAIPEFSNLSPTLRNDISTIQLENSIDSLTALVTSKKKEFEEYNTLINDRVSYVSFFVVSNQGLNVNRDASYKLMANEILNVLFSQIENYNENTKYAKLIFNDDGTVQCSFDLVKIKPVIAGFKVDQIGLTRVDDYVPYLQILFELKFNEPENNDQQITLHESALKTTSANITMQNKNEENIISPIQMVSIGNISFVKNGDNIDHFVYDNTKWKLISNNTLSYNDFIISDDIFGWMLPDRQKLEAIVNLITNLEKEGRGITQTLGIPANNITFLTNEEKYNNRTHEYERETIGINADGQIFSGNAASGENTFILCTQQ